VAPRDDLSDWGDRPERERAAFDHLADRCRRLEEELKRVRDRVDDYLALKERVKQLEKAQKEIEDEMSGLRKALYTAAISIAGGAILFAATIFQVLGS
jgi:DNA repair exonuclease SbcCD ATPase subunit